MNEYENPYLLLHFEQMRFSSNFRRQLHLFRVKSKRLILGGKFCWLTINKATRFVHISFGCCNRHSDPVIG